MEAKKEPDLRTWPNFCLKAAQTTGKTAILGSPVLALTLMKEELLWSPGLATGG